MKPVESKAPTHFIRTLIEKDIASGKNQGRVVTRFPPEPNGYLHIGHAKSICLNFGMAQEFGGQCHLRFDDTNPLKEDVEYLAAIQADVEWLGFEWTPPIRYASGYFEALYGYALQLIETGKAYVCGLSLEEMREYRGTLTTPGRESVDRDHSIEENRSLFQQMRAGAFADGTYCLRAKIDMASPNINLRDPVLYRILHATHHQTGNVWPIYPMYDFAHALSDSIEGITHSLCTLEFEDHRPLYDWILDQLDVPCHPQQIEFSRLALAHTVMSKRKLNRLVQEGHVKGWDDPRMPSISGLKRRGYTPASIRLFCERIGISKSDGVIPFEVLEGCVREDLERQAPRVMAVLNPLKVIIDNYPEGKTETREVDLHPQQPEQGQRTIPFSRELYIDRNDFCENPAADYKRLSPDVEVRLRHSYVIRCHQVLKDPHTGDILALHCTYDENTLGKNPEGRKVKGVIHWVSAPHAIPADVRIYDHLFLSSNPSQLDDDLGSQLNPESLRVEQVLLESSLAHAIPGNRYQFEREGYFCVDPDSTSQQLVFNRIVSLREGWFKK